MSTNQMKLITCQPRGVVHGAVDRQTAVLCERSLVMRSSAAEAIEYRPVAELHVLRD